MASSSSVGVGVVIGIDTTEHDEDQPVVSSALASTLGIPTAQEPPTSIEPASPEAGAKDEAIESPTPPKAKTARAALSAHRQRRGAQDTRAASPGPSLRQADMVVGAQVQANQSSASPGPPRSCSSPPMRSTDKSAKRTIGLDTEEASQPRMRQEVLNRNTTQ